MLRFQISPLKRKRNFFDSISNINPSYLYYPLFPFPKRMKLNSKPFPTPKHFSSPPLFNRDIEMSINTPPIQLKLNQEKINNLLISNAIRTETTFAKLFSKHYNYGKRIPYKEDPERMQID